MKKIPNRSERELEYVNCLLCGTRDHEEIIWKDYKNTQIVCCRKCGLVYRNPRNVQSRQEQIFAQEWTEGIGNFFLTNYRSLNLRQIAKYIQREKPRGCLLDIGCSYGTFFNYFSNSWQLTGIEPSLLASRVAAKRFPHVRIINDTIENVSLPQGEYDVITIIDTIYYLPRPLEVLIKCYNLLKPNGWLLIEAPNFLNRYHFYRLVGHKFSETWMYFYTPRTLGQLLKSVNFELKTIFHILPHSIGSKKKIKKLMSYVEFTFWDILYKASMKRLDLHSHFVTVAKRS